MAKKNKKKGRKSKVRAKKAQALQTKKSGAGKKCAPAAKDKSGILKKTVKAPVSGGTQIKLSEKISLEKSTHSYRSFFHRRYGKYFKRVKKPARIILKIVTAVFLTIFLFVAALFLVFGRDLPDVSGLKTMNFSETTRIYDREGNVLYSIFGDENREYVPLSYIAPDAVDATLSIEDKNFYGHFGFDPVSMVRAQMKNIQEDSISQGASTITQQLAKNIFLSPERTYKRKIKELLLSLQIEWMYSKGEILEMYMNKIAYGSNAFGIEAAAQTFFGKSSKDLDLIESAVLASLPKAPSYYSPYGQNKKELMGYCKPADDQPQKIGAADEEALLSADSQELAAAEQANVLKIAAKGTVWIQAVADGRKDQFTLKEKEEKDIEFKDQVQFYAGNDQFQVFINEKPLKDILQKKYLTFTSQDWQDYMDDSKDLNPEPLPLDPVCSTLYDSNYVRGRKDHVLQRMLEDRYITAAQMENAWRNGFSLKFRDPVHMIESPHFVFYVKEILEKKYGKEMVESGGLEVKTTLDPKLQSIAEEAVAAHSQDNLKRYGANNAALVAIDPKTGQILSMVGSVDYWDEKIDGQVNVATSPRQPGSSFKPLVYAAAIQKTGIGSGTILSDYKTLFNKKDIPRNADNTYRGKMTVRTALSNSRNIPAIKAYYLAGEEEELLNFLDKAGLQSLRKFRDDFNKDAETRGWTFFYGWPMAIGSGEVSLLDLAGAYGTFANDGKFVPANPLLEVRDRKGNTLEKFEPPEGEQVIDQQVAFIINSILSDVLAKPAGTWRNSMTITGHSVASKTGTSSKKIGRGIYPNNNIMIGYTPAIVAAVWVGNTDGGRMLGNAWAFADAGPIWKQFLTEVLKDSPDEKFPEPAGLKWIGKEVYPAFADLKTNFDSRFKRIETQETIEVPESTLVAGSGESKPNSEKPINAEASSPSIRPGKIVLPEPTW